MSATPPPMRIVLPIDFSDAGEPAEREAVRLARALGAEILLVHVASRSASWPASVYTPQVRAVFAAQRTWAEDALVARAAAIAAQGVGARAVVADGQPDVEIVRLAAEQHAHMIVMGTQGRTGLDRLLLGSVAERVVRTAPCPVLTVRPGPPRNVGPVTRVPPAR
jgi:nucleotide-binding universal stress UspA family protein